MRLLNTGLIVLVLLLTAGTPANAQLIVNGDFEDPDIPGEWGNFAQIAGWTVAYGTIDIQSGPGPHTGEAVPPGTQFIELDANSNSSIFQNVYTETGKQYTLSFYYSPRNGIPMYGIQVGSHTTGIDVSWENQYLTTVAQEGPWEKVNYWSQYSYSVTANNPIGISQLQFSGTGDSDGYGGLLDKVELTLAPATRITAPTVDLQDGPPMEESHVSPHGDGEVGGLYGIYLRGDGVGGDPNYRWSIRGGPEALPNTLLAALPDTDLDGSVDEYFLTFAHLAEAGAKDRAATAPYTLRLEALNSGGIPIGGSESEILLLIPEPATLSLLALGGLAVLRRRRK